MSRNVSKNETSIFTLPQDAIREDRGLSTCGVPQLVLADINDPISWKNDKTLVGAYKFDTMTVQLEDESGTLTTALGIAYSLQHQSDALAFTIDWRQTLNGLGALAQGCYKVRVNWTKSGNSGWFYKGAYQLLEYTIFNARSTARIYYVLNDLVESEGVNYKNSGAAGTIRFKGIFGFMQPNYETVNNTHTDKTSYKVSNIAKRSYELHSSYLLGCMTESIDEVLLAANQIYISDHNAAVHKQYFDFPVILHDEESPSYDYPKGSVYATINAKFFKKKNNSISKYDGNIGAATNQILNLPTTVASCPAGAVTLDSAALVSVPSGSTVDVQLEDQTGATITPTSIVGGVIEIEFPPKTYYLLDFFTLNENNPFGNNNRFTDEFGGQDYLTGIIINWISRRGDTVQGFQRTVVGNKNHADAITECAAFSAGTFSTGWYLPEIDIFIPLNEYDGTTNTLSYAPFNITYGGFLWSITDRETTKAMISYPFQGQISFTLKTDVTSRGYIPSRDFTITGTVLT